MVTYKKLQTIKILGLGTLLLGFAQTPAMSFNLDLFTDFNQGLQVVETGFTDPADTFVEDRDTSLNTTNVFGGERLIRTTKLNSSIGRTSLILSGGEASASAGANVIGKAEIIWDGNDGIATDFTANDHDSIKLVEEGANKDTIIRSKS